MSNQYAGEFHYMFPKKVPVLYTDPEGNDWQPQNFSCEYKICWETPRFSSQEVCYVTTIELLLPLKISLANNSLCHKTANCSYTGSPDITVNKIVITNETDHELKFSQYVVDVYHNGGEGSANIYTDTAIPEAISRYLALPLEWSEYLQQADGVFNLEIDFHNKIYKDYIPATEYPL